MANERHSGPLSKADEIVVVCKPELPAGCGVVLPVIITAPGVPPASVHSVGMCHGGFDHRSIQVRASAVMNRA